MERAPPQGGGGSRPRTAGASLLALALAVPALVAGCGGDDASPPGPPAAPAKAPPAAAPGPRFEECAEKAGLRFRTTFLRFEQGERFHINLYDHGCGLAVADYDGDGDDDVYLLNQLGRNGLFRNRGDGTFEDVTAEAGVGLETLICSGAVFGDADGDGDRDLFVTTVRGGNVHFENLGNGSFADSTRKAGLSLVAESMGASFFDADGDGDLDLLVTNTGRWTLDDFDQGEPHFRGKETLAEVVTSEKLRNVLYLNDGAGRFTDGTEAAGIGGNGWAGDVAVFDMEDDGDPDVYVCNMFGADSLFRNDGKGRFTDVAREVLGRTSWGSVGCRAFDADGDGRLDLLVADMHSDMWMDMDVKAAFMEPAVKYPRFLARPVALGWKTPAEADAFDRLTGMRGEDVLFGNTLFLNRGGGRFEEVSDRAGVETLWPWGVVEGDFDDDGPVDAFLPAGMGFPFFYWPSSLLWNRGDGTFADAAAAAGLEPPPGGTTTGTAILGIPCARSARAAATADFDGDGRLDIVQTNFNDRAFLWRNASPSARWCRLRLVGKGPNRDAVGAVARLTAGGRTQVRQVQAAGGYLSQSSNVLHFGLGGADAVEKVEIRWPDGGIQVLVDIPVDRLTEVKQEAGTFLTK